MPSAMAKRQHDGDTDSTSDTAALATSAAATADTSSKFHHPYTPYDVQMQFMKTVYDICERGDGQVGILESPTGTGKSLSLICGALTWLREHKRKQFELSVAVDKTDPKYADEPDWLVEQMLKQRRKELAGRWERREERLRDARRKEKAAERGVKRRRVELTRAERESRAEEEFLLEDESARDEDRLSWFSADTRARLQKAGLTAKDTVEEDDDEDVGDDIKIYYTSRTHSQLTQFIAELRRPTFPSSVPETVSAVQTEIIKHIPLSSRQRLCINPSVNRLGSVAAINDRCAELQKPKTTKDKATKQKGCQYVLSAENKAQTHQFRDTALATVPDIEDLYQLGTALHVCPYYASRTAVPGAEIISLPYPLLLQKEARDALGINLNSKNSIVIIDEAHNIMDAVASVHAAGIRLSELRRARALLGVYVKRFGKRLGHTSRLMVGQLGIVIAALYAWALQSLQSLQASQTKTSSGIVDPTALLKHKGADQINMFTLVKYIQESKLAYKVEGYAAHIDESDGRDDKTLSPVLHALSSFLLALTNLSSEGRIFYDAADGDVRLSYLLLSPTHAFSSIASSARAVILAGGTMSPFADYKTHLFPGLPAPQLTTLSCGHVIPASNLCVVTLASMRPAGAGGVFDFSFAHRGDAAVVHNLGLAMLNICTIVPDGVVVFFPSYAYLDEVVQKWTSSGLLAKLESKKKVLRESKGCSSDDVLSEYAGAINEDKGGALLLSVVGGKMSEGINFADRLGRCVVIVGLPFPNLHSADWKARMEYIEASAAAAVDSSLDAASSSTPSTTLKSTAAAKEASREYYENACMRAVNQSIGRAIRHQNDYASIILLDRRFGSDRIRSKLPGWIRAGMPSTSTSTPTSTSTERQDVGGMMTMVGAFFRGKK
ncbi:dna repair helicase [Ophiostoma piceae UAMH 11346]|uniref:ATP-dependent DNA helicase CHL1 n=1 Tax=Ophiostoma piceae (strain UAMH 11346) TaxID=1262450 RepID=S3CDI7_OPHP1|nr:dna repair helicase [Ophiostoma piceae UAMH 11346]